MPQSRFATFAIALPLHRVFDYQIEMTQKAEPGTRFRLPFANRVKTGILLAERGSSGYAVDKIKPVEEQIDEQPVLDAHILALARWMSDYYLQPIGEVVFQCLPAYLRGQRPYHPVRAKLWRLVSMESETLEALRKRSPRQYEISQALREKPEGLSAVDLKAINPNWHTVIKTLQEKGLVDWDWQDSPPVIHEVELPELKPEQQAILDEIEPDLDRFIVHLLDGVTGSGKTEIYLRLIAARLAAGYQVIYLVPEIGLTSQLIDRITARFGNNFAISHSGLTDLQRYRAWDQFRRGQVRIMLGTRSSLFSQSDNLGLIVIDEEHDHSYRQEDGVRYHARDVAIKRAQMLEIPIVLGSATPSLESVHNCERQHYRHYHLSQRATAFPPPKIQLQDIRGSHLNAGCSTQTLEKIEHHLSAGGQALIYLNRRGFAPVVMCHDCGWQAMCQHCDARLTLHQSVNRLICHHCGFSQTLPENCPECENPDIKHHGIGTEQLEQGLTQRFPQTPVLRIDRDVIESGNALKARLQQLKSGEPCILVGTQMIAKGHDYPAITLSVMLDADQALFSASYRAAERLTQTLLQVSGRAGRGDRAGEAIVQTRFPEHPLMHSLVSSGYRKLVDDLLAERRLLGLPPYARVVMFRADAVDLKTALEKLEGIREILSVTPNFGAVNCIGPMPALMTRRIGRYRAQLALVGPDHVALRGVLQQALPGLEAVPGTTQVSWNIDVDAFDL